MELKIVHFYPDLMSLYGSYANVSVLRRYLEALSTYTRRRMTQAAKAQVDEVLYIPASLALHQRPAVPGIRMLSAWNWSRFCTAAVPMQDSLI